ncbi:MAG: transposase [Pseudonocardiaceae bacterium]
MGRSRRSTRSSMSVQRQYTGTLGRVDNCQIATFLGYVTAGRDRILVDRRLYMPKESWMADPARCAAAGVPPGLTFKTRPVQVRERSGPHAGQRHDRSVSVIVALGSRLSSR